MFRVGGVCFCLRSSAAYGYNIFFNDVSLILAWFDVSKAQWLSATMLRSSHSFISAMGERAQSV
jgi:hypothetical protein